MASDPGGFNIDDINDYLTAGKSAVALIKSTIGLLPKGSERDKAEEDIARAEKALEVSRAAAAKALGYRLCQCTFPPQIMLWREQEDAHVCPNPECGRRDERPKANPIGGRGSLVDARRGRGR